MALTELYTPTHVYFGKGAENIVADVLKKEGAKKVLIHFGKGSVLRSGLLSKTEKLLKEAGIQYVELGGVVPNPRISLIREGVNLARKEGVDYVLAVGGGSVIDSAKAICYGLYDSAVPDPWAYYIGEATPKGAFPLGVILTLAATGSEMSDSSVITNDEGGFKRGLNSNISRARFALMNPELTYSVSPYQTSCGTVDIMMHTIERFFHHGSSLDLTDRLAMTLIKETMEKGKTALIKPDDYEARSDIMWAGSLSHNGLMNIGYETRGDWACHQMEHELSGMFDVSHGAGLAAIWATWARYVYKDNMERFAKFGKGVFNLSPDMETEECALETIKLMEKYFSSINMPTSIRELKIDPTDAQLREMARKCSFFGKRTIGSFRVLKEEDIYNIYKAAL